ncbi:MBL fold metallo-hydrolase [Paenibacillus ferrarius]|uniref:MBL fold metallo-hydrolase n=1 Tax=Paenibacillus ferrarius TaxID=1469647 RepID=UPI003D292B47
MLNVHFMGTASASGSVERENTYLLLESGERCWMIDVGGNPLGKLKQTGISLDRIQGVLVTHFHVDHIYGLPSMLWGMWIARRRDPLTIYCAGEHKDQLTAILASYRVADWPILFTIHIHDFDWTEPAVVISEEGLTVSTFPSLHVGATVGVKVESGGSVLIYSADTMPNEIIGRQGKIDVLIHEATKAKGSANGHTSLEELLDYYPFDQFERVYAVHLTDGEPYAEVLAACGAAIKAKVTLAYDMLRIDV